MGGVPHSQRSTFDRRSWLPRSVHPASPLTLHAVTSGEIAQADAARKWGVDVSTIIGIRRTVKDAAMAALQRGPGRPGKERD